jgi:hypothetical protein
MGTTERISERFHDYHRKKQFRRLNYFNSENPSSGEALRFMTVRDETADGFAGTTDKQFCIGLGGPASEFKRPR